VRARGKRRRVGRRSPLGVGSRPLGVDAAFDLTEYERGQTARPGGNYKVILGIRYYMHIFTNVDYFDRLYLELEAWGLTVELQE